jgi:hypothetical protein
MNSCKECHKEIDKNKKFCDRKCYDNWRKIPENNPNFGNHKLTGKNNPNYKDGKFSDNPPRCIECNEIISINALKTGLCQKCYLKSPKNTFYIDGRNKNKYYCIEPNCGIEINYNSYHYGTQRCRPCMVKYMFRIGKLDVSGEKNPCWLGGISFEPYPLGWNKTFREQIRYRDGYKCQLCGKSEIECNRKLAVHHIDYDKDNLNPKNLISLCISCHMKTNTNREYWKEYFLTGYEKPIEIKKETNEKVS